MAQMLKKKWNRMISFLYSLGILPRFLYRRLYIVGKPESFYQASCRGDIQDMERRLKEGVESEEIVRSLEHVFRNEDERVLLFFLEQDYATLALQLAIKHAPYNIIKLILDNGADVNAWCKDGQKVIHVAVYTRDPQVVELLLEYGVNPNEETMQGVTPIVFAVGRLNDFIKEASPELYREIQRIVKLLHERGGKVKKSGFGRAILKQAEEEGWGEGIINHLKGLDADFDRRLREALET